MKLQQKVQSDQLFTYKITTGITWYKNWQILFNSGWIAFQIFIISYLTYQSSTFKTLIKEKNKSSRFKNFRQFRGFAWHYESAESVEGRFSYLKKNSKQRLTPWTKVLMGGEYLVWEGKENFRGFRDFRRFRGIDLALKIYFFSSQQFLMFSGNLTERFYEATFNILILSKK